MQQKKLIKMVSFHDVCMCVFSRSNRGGFNKGKIPNTYDSVKCFIPNCTTDYGIFDEIRNDFFFLLNFLRVN